MRRSRLCVAVGATALGLLGVGQIARADSQKHETYPLSEVRRGQKGYGLTTMKGTTPERFEFEVIAVNKNFLPKMDIILVKSDDPKLKVSGFWQGMSGSPMFIDGKLTCAFSYAFRFSQIAIGGCTPIEYMKQEGFKPRRMVQTASGKTRPSQTRSTSRQLIRPRQAATQAEWLQVVPHGRIGSAMARKPSLSRSWLLGAPVPRGPHAPDEQLDDRSMTASALPLSLSGFSSPAFQEVKKLVANYPLEPVRAGGTGSSNGGPTEFVPGGAISVQLIRGDMSAASSGTVSFVKGDGVLAFGHPLFQAGEIYAPVSTAEVHTVMPSANISFFIASPMRELGALTQDRQSTISADTGLKTRMIPVDIFIEAGNGKHRDKGEFHVEVLDNRFFTAAMAGISTMNAVSLYLPDRDHVTATITSQVKVKGYKPLKFVDRLYSGTGAFGVVGGARGLRALAPLLRNPFAPVEIESVRLDVDLDWDTNYGDIEALRLPEGELEPGAKSYVDVELTRFDGKRVVDRVPFHVPDHLAGSIVKLEVTSGDSAMLDAAPPQSVDDLMAALQKMLPGNVYAVTLYTADAGAAIDGKLVRDLPSSALDKLYTGSETPRVSAYRAIARSTSRASRVINGKQSVLVKVQDKKD